MFVLLIPTKYTKPFVKGQKNDYNDAEAITAAELLVSINAAPKISGLLDYV
ncbi:MAG: hypothetical protein O7D94_13480 [Planctomycetota bacterium]|nr:hypothetical protein [Planctomycetota bacterium]